MVNRILSKSLDKVPDDFLRAILDHNEDENDEIGFKLTGAGLGELDGVHVVCGSIDTSTPFLTTPSK